MSIISINDLSFSYPMGKKALESVSISVPEGSFVTICGASGCGKSTLLRLLKPGLFPHGKRDGEIFYNGESLSSLSAEKSAREIGFVMQDPDSQIVTDKVWHELAFSLESVGVAVGDIRRRVGEMAAYFGIEEQFEQNTASLSGGQKQLLNLASAAALHPKLLILDEPTSQLDPIAAQGFIDTISRLNRDFGVTVIIAEHRLEELLPISDRIIVMEKGRVIADSVPREICTVLPTEHSMMSAMPVSVRLYSMGGGKENAPLSVREGRENKLCRDKLNDISEKKTEKSSPRGEPIISARELWMSYGRTFPDVLKNVSIDVCEGSIYAILGGNGSGKTTLLKALAGIVRPLGGRVKRRKGSSAAYLPQNPCELFTEDTVKEELKVVSEDYIEMAERFSLTEHFDSNPYDLSGGEKQRLAIAKQMLKKPDVLLLDEPTKGMDSTAKAEFSLMLRSIAKEGAAVVLVTHDTELAAACVDICGLLFNGEIVSEDIPEVFFTENYFYTTPACRLARGIAEGIISI